MPRDPDDEFDVEDFLIRKLEEIPGVDILILATGAMLGANGYTPITALLNIAQGTFKSVADNVRASNDALRQIGVDPSILDILPFGAIAKFLAPAIVSPPTTAMTTKTEAYRNQVIMAGIGAIESYALTRPGVAVGIAQAIAEALPL